MISFLRLVRLPNLVLIFLVQYLLRYCLVLPAFTAEYFITNIFPSHLSDFHFSLLSMSTVFIAAGGYVINDYYDIFIDQVNKPEKVLIGKQISKRNALTAYGILTISGILIGFYLAYHIHKPVMGFVNVFAAVSLWMYSAQLKKKILIGNLLIAFLSALAILVVGLFEPEFYRNFLLIVVYAVFAFMTNFIRELIKSMEDMDGDARGQVKSLPIKIGIKKTKLVVLLLVVITAWMLGNMLFRAFYINTVISFWNIFIFCELPFIVLLFLVASASEKKDFHFASLITKIIMLLGILTLVPLYFFFIR